MTRRARNGMFTAERTTEETHTKRVTERLTFEEDDTLTDLRPVLGLDAIPQADWEAQGWDPGPIQPHGMYLAQRRAQLEQALGLLVTVAQSLPPGELTPAVRARWVGQAVTILRAGPKI